MRRILVVAETAGGLALAEQRAGLLAGASGAKLELLAIASDDDVQQKLLTESLQRRADKLFDRALDVSCVAVHGTDPVATVLARVAETGPDLVVKEIRRQGTSGRGRYSNADWELIRRCPVPLLLVKRDAWQAGGPVVAAVDPLHLRDKPAELDRRILAHGRELATMLDGQLWALHCWPPEGAEPGAGDDASIEQYDAAHRERLAALVEGLDIAPQHVIAARGRVETELCDMVADIGANVTVMGAVSRSRLRRWILGNTAEKILDRIVSDVLVIKPAQGD